MLDRLKGLRAPMLALALIGAGVLQASSQAPAAPEPAAAAAQAPVAPVALTAGDLNIWLDGFMPFALEDAGIMGAIVTVVKDGEIVANRGFGYVDPEARTPVNPETTLFRPGSVSKLFTWTAVMQMVERGELDLDADVNQYIDFEIPNYEGAPITLRNILTHTTGFEEVIRELFDDSAGELELGDYLKRNLPARIFPAGTMPAYSNYATALAGYIVERKSGEPFNDYIAHHIFEPLGMARSTFDQPVPEAWQGDLSPGFRNRGDTKAQEFEVIGPAPAGSLSSTGSDMARFMSAFLNEGGVLVRPETARQIFETVDQQFPGVNSMALGFYQDNMNGQRVFGHGGDTRWFHTNLALFVDQNVGVFISFNSNSTQPLAPLTLRLDFTKAFADRYFPGAPMGPDPEPLETALAHGAAVVGDYDSARRIESNPFRALSFLGTTKVTMAENGDLMGPGLPSVSGSPQRWREVEPWVWQVVGGHERMGARLDENGQVIAFGAEPLAFAVPNMRSPWYRTSSLWMPLLLTAIGVVLLTLLSWPMRAIVRRVYKTKFPYEGARAVAHRFSIFASIVALVYLGAWSGFLIWLLESLPDTPESIANGGFTALYAAGVLPPVAIGMIGFANFKLWRAPSHWFAKLWGVVLALAMIVILWVAVAIGFYSFNYSY